MRAVPSPSAPRASQGCPPVYLSRELRNGPSRCALRGHEQMFAQSFYSGLTAFGLVLTPYGQKDLVAPLPTPASAGLGNWWG